METWQIALYLLPTLALMYLYVRRMHNVESRHRTTLSESVEAGLGEPVSLHPVVDPVRCMGSGACVAACPEQALGIIDGKAQLIDASACIGHGACAAACPFEAIHLVFGTEARGVDIPQVSPAFETNVPGIFIAGELGGMGLIHKATEQGRRAIETISRRTGDGRRRGAELDLVIVGAGPAGLSASLAAKQKGLKYVTIEQESALGGSILHYPRQKLAMTVPMDLPIVGKVVWREISKESLLEFWSDVVRRTGLNIRFGERMETLKPETAGFRVITPRGAYSAASVLLSIGRRGTPRKLGVPGETQEKVVYRLMDPQQYRRRRVLVVGGGDSAIEAALAVCAEEGAEVVLSYRGKAFSRVKPKNRKRFDEALAAARLRTLMESTVTAIEHERVQIAHRGTPLMLPNDAVIVCAGGELPTPMLKDIGVMVATHYGTAAVAR
ncbi:MAG: NAD(P)-binding domain-containing protein [Burkholderiales bacterium]